MKETMLERRDRIDREARARVEREDTERAAQAVVADGRCCGAPAEPIATTRFSDWHHRGLCFGGKTPCRRAADCAALYRRLYNRGWATLADCHEPAQGNHGGGGGTFIPLPDRGSVAERRPLRRRPASMSAVTTAGALRPVRRVKRVRAWTASCVTSGARRRNEAVPCPWRPVSAVPGHITNGRPGARSAGYTPTWNASARRRKVFRRVGKNKSRSGKTNYPI